MPTRTRWVFYIRRLLLLSLGFSATIYINTHVVLFETLQGLNSVSYSTSLIGVSILNLLLFAYLVKVLFDIAVRNKTVPFDGS